MITPDGVSRWVAAYQAAWTSNEPDDIRALFTDDAVYNGRPNDPDAWRGADGIVAGWLDHRDEPGDWTFEWNLLGISGDVAYVQNVTGYAELPDYDNLWKIVFDDEGRAREFTEWAMARE